MGTGNQDVILAPVSVGELLDKITILRIKTERIRDPGKRALAQFELDQLSATRARHVPDDARVERHCDDLKQVNEALWDIEDRIRSRSGLLSSTRSSSNWRARSTSPMTVGPRSSGPSTSCWAPVSSK